jgi:hypothetical protein
MSLVTVMQYVKGVLDGLEIPGNTGPLTAFIVAPDPDENEWGTPRAMIWTANGGTSRLGLGRDPHAGTGGSKIRKHRLAIYLWYPMADEEPDEDSAFPGVLDAVMAALEYTPDPVVLQNAVGPPSQMAGLGEEMTWQMADPLALASQRWEKFMALITAPVIEEYDP